MILLIFLLILVLLFLLRWYQFHHIDYKWEKKRHFPQWTNSGVITRDNYLLRTNYNFVEDSRCVVIGVHSMGGSKEDFNLAKDFFHKQKISFLSFDQRNWGENGKWKYHSLGTTVSDIEDIINVVIERFPKQKIILLGDSFGSSLVALALKRLDNQVAGAILTNFVTKNWNFKLTASLFFKLAAGLIFYKNILLPITYDPSDLSDRTEYVDAVNERNYRRNNKSFTLLYLMQAKNSTKSVVKNINDTVSPVLVIQSGEDILADYDKVEDNEKKWRKGVTYKFYKKGKHAILNDSHTDAVLKDIEKWISGIKG
ncbi:alpha/beta fold hydrolase [Spiroplasma platyhelix]|uniref:alpha/beta fold hydrolase n=1 Tax=Spiroplasma platyhelix TaxID=301585 RepID=UPI001F36F5B7|nr:alpha/beta fold hydrolase [Spiroplasma platyhelix]